MSRSPQPIGSFNAGIHPISCAWSVAYNVYESGMPRFKLKGVLERSAAGDLWKHTLSRIPTLFGRIAYLSSLRDSNSGIYRHHGLSALFGRDDSTKALRESHERAFHEWLGLKMEEKYYDLTRYLAELDDPAWRRVGVRSGNLRLSARNRSDRPSHASGDDAWPAASCAFLMVSSNASRSPQNNSRSVSRADPGT